MRKLSGKVVFLGITLLLLIAGWFYWFQWRPAEIRKSCYPRAIEAARELYKTQLELAPGELSDKDIAEIKAGMHLKDSYESYYQDCLRKNGLE